MRHHGCIRRTKRWYLACNNFSDKSSYFCYCRLLGFVFSGTLKHILRKRRLNARVEGRGFSTSCRGSQTSTYLQIDDLGVLYESILVDRSSRLCHYSPSRCCLLVRIRLNLSMMRKPCSSWLCERWIKMVCHSRKSWSSTHHIFGIQFFFSERVLTLQNRELGSCCLFCLCWVLIR